MSAQRIVSGDTILAPQQLPLVFCTEISIYIHTNLHMCGYVCTHVRVTCATLMCLLQFIVVKLVVAIILPADQLAVGVARPGFCFIL